MAAGGLLNQMFNGGDMPGYQTTPVSPTTQALINQQNQYASRPVQDFQSQHMSGVQDQGDAVNAAEAPVNQFTGGLGMSQNAALGKAMDQRSGRMFGGTVANMQREAAPHAYSQKMQAIQQAYGLNQREGQINLEQAEGMRNADQEKRKARNATVAGLIGGGLGAVGAVVGGMFGGPMGAQKGQQGGSAIGGGAAGLSEGE